MTTTNHDHRTDTYRLAGPYMQLHGMAGDSTIDIIDFHEVTLHAAGVPTRSWHAEVIWQGRTITVPLWAIES
jgi:hypothetical protein